MKSRQKIVTTLRKTIEASNVKKNAVFLIIMLGIVAAVLPGRLSKYFLAAGYYSKYEDMPEAELEYSSERTLMEEDFLTVLGTDIVNRNGEKVILRGVNLGGWLLQEYWMCPVTGDPQASQWTHTETLEVLTQRFGEEKAGKLLEQYADNWITEWDMQNIAVQGCNVVRVPFGYWNFMKDAEGTWLT